MLTQELFTMSRLSPSLNGVQHDPPLQAQSSWFEPVINTLDIHLVLSEYIVILFWTHYLYYMIEITFPGILVWNLIELKLVSTFYAKLFSCNSFKTSYRFTNLNQIYIKQLLTMKRLCSNLGLPTFTAFFRKLLNE